MSITTRATSGRPSRIAQTVQRIRATAGRMSDRAHGAGDVCAREQGWTVTWTPGPLGLSGRLYRDPRFDSRRSRP